jgi:hypothetical protein
MSRGKRLPPLCYRDALDWMLDNDDVSFVEEEDPAISVTGAIVADIYDRTNEEVIEDLRKRRLRRCH